MPESIEASAVGSAICPVKAVIFTHLGKLRYCEGHGRPGHDCPKSFMARQPGLEARYTKVIDPYLKCGRNVAIVYAYVDWAVAGAISSESSGFAPDAVLLQQERELVDFLTRIERSRRRSLGLSQHEPPKFQYVGVEALIALLNDLVAVDPALTRYLAGPEGKFTYDSPKFVEAVIRLARGHAAHLAQHPILRIDEDAEPNQDAVARLLEGYEEVVRERPFYLFSGTYGHSGGFYDLLNNHAVRMHWFLDPAVPGPPPAALTESFLSDLTELGGRQLAARDAAYSSGMNHLLSEGRPQSEPARPSPQAISGAGLIMSSRAVSFLPPFMNLANLTTWVDDHLKRLLHEALGDLGSNDIECVLDARFRQDRHPDGVTTKNVDDAEKDYFDRLLRGCLFNRVIKKHDGSPTTYSTFVGDIVRYRAGGDLMNTAIELHPEIVRHGEERYEEVITCWSSDEFRQYRSCGWAKRQRREPQHKVETCRAVADDAIRYVSLVVKWPIFTRAIDRLRYDGNAWLFEPVD